MYTQTNSYDLKQNYIEYNLHRTFLFQFLTKYIYSPFHPITNCGRFTCDLRHLLIDFSHILCDKYNLKLIFSIQSLKCPILMLILSKY